jgi:hypothetical protein
MTNTKTPPLHQSQLAEDRPDAYRYARRIREGCQHQLACRCDPPYWLREPSPSELARWFKVQESEQEIAR